MPTNRLLAEYWASTAWDPAALARVSFTATGPTLPSRLATTELAAGAVAAAGLAAASLAACGSDVDIENIPLVRVDALRVAAAFSSDRLQLLDGRNRPSFAPLSGFFATADGWVRTHANYPHHHERLTRALGLPADVAPDRFAAVVGAFGAQEVEDRVTAVDGIAVAVRSPARWAAHPQAQALSGLPLVETARLADAPRRVPTPASLPGSAAVLPAAGLRVLDLTRVIAGPVATRTLALLGADVLRIDPPGLPEIEWQQLDTGQGKRSAVLDLRSADDRVTFEGLLARADVVVTGYRPGALDSCGLVPAELVARRPGLVVASLSAWGPAGPWQHRRGFDSVVQAATGIAQVEAKRPAVPGALAAQALDHATGYLLAAGILDAVHRQLRHGGSWQVRAHLARTAAWLLAHPAVDLAAAAFQGAASDPLPAPDFTPCLAQRATYAGRLTYPLPALEFAGGPVDFPEPPRRWGTDAPCWRSWPGHAGALPAARPGTHCALRPPHS